MRKRWCRHCKRDTRFYRMKEDRNLIYCDECNRAYDVGPNEASWYEEDDNDNRDEE